ncbi:metalloregulator ArsR/SmtB family transcription factor [Longimicrobium sp.]|uniref:ArsR/SmtB family transcription factor n=1 Tax=Longimicrobium sp. TaxID=2029185 RepID=UPI002D80C5BB|nr:metalloregulator ArsR/SmtB family transcription factor [Longimicrobium sp.]
MSALADSTRSRLLLVLERHELTVGELCAVVQLPQSTVSRHLKTLGDEDWVSSRAEGTSRRYRMSLDRLEPSAKRLWTLVREQVASLPAAEQDVLRLGSVLAQRSTRSQEFFSTAAGQWDRLRAELFGRRADLLGLLGMLDPAWTVGDLGCGTGQVSESLAPFVRRVVAVDGSPAMLGAAHGRLDGIANVEVRAGELEALPIADGELDAALLFLVLHYVAEPAAALAEARRVLRPGGVLLVVDMTPHDREEYRQAMGHVWLGFAPDELQGWMTDADLGGFRYVALPADPAAKGPALFAARATAG